MGSKNTIKIKRVGNLNHNDLDSHCIDLGMVNFKKPKEYFFIKEIPKSPTGKILRRKIIAGEYELE